MQVTDEVMPVHALMALWDAQTNDSPDEFRLVTEQIDSDHLIGGLVFAVTFLCTHWATDINQGCFNIVETGRATYRVGQTWAAAGGHAPDVTEAISGLGVAITMGPSVVDDSINMELIVRKHEPYSMAIASLVPLNILRRNIVQNGLYPDEESFIGWLRQEFWRIEMS